jgi:hypothetical protein
MPQELSLNMRRALRGVLRGNSSDISTSTFQALAKRRLLSEDRSLTQLGRATAILLVPLAEQCRHMAIPLEEMANPNDEILPEIAAWEHYRQNGFVGAYCEGGSILLLIRAAALDTLASLNSFNSRADARERFTEAQLVIHRDKSAKIIETIEAATADHVMSNFQEIYKSSFIQEVYPSLTVEAILSLFLALGSERLSVITKAIMEEPYQYRSGWPDLTMIRDGSIHWVEVKTNDKLHMSQIVTLSRMKNLLSGELKVLHLTK